MREIGYYWVRSKENEWNVFRWNGIFGPQLAAAESVKYADALLSELNQPTKK